VSGRGYYATEPALDVPGRPTEIKPSLYVLYDRKALPTVASTHARMLESEETFLSHVQFKSPSSE
jgi:hypothetical protein